MGFKKGNPGKPMGAKNKIPRGLQEKVLHACEILERNGQDLATIALKKPEWFYETFVKAMLPKELIVSGGKNPLKLFLVRQLPSANKDDTPDA